MTKAKINTQHDYVTLRITFDDGGTFNLTRSRGGVRASGTSATREALEFFDAFIQSRKDSTIGETMQHLCAAAQRSPTMASFIGAA